MKLHWAFAVAIILLLAVIPSTAFPAAIFAGVEAQRKAEDIASGITISAEQRKRQVEPSEAATQALYKRLEAKTARRRIVVHRCGLTVGLGVPIEVVRLGQPTILGQRSITAIRLTLRDRRPKVS